VTRVIRLKVHTKKPQNSIPNKSNIEGWNWKKKSIIQEDQKQKRSIKKLMIKIKIKNKSNCFFFKGKIINPLWQSIMDLSLLLLKIYYSYPFPF
jgi:hypothetical protein